MQTVLRALRVVGVRGHDAAACGGAVGQREPTENSGREKRNKTSKLSKVGKLSKSTCSWKGVNYWKEWILDSRKKNLQTTNCKTFKEWTANTKKLPSATRDIHCQGSKYIAVWFFPMPGEGLKNCAVSFKPKTMGFPGEFDWLALWATFFTWGGRGSKHPRRYK